MSTDSVFSFFAGFLGIIGVVIITFMAIAMIRIPLRNFLSHILKDQTVADFGVSFALILLGIEGIKAALGFITQPFLSTLFSGLTALLVNLVDSLEWIVYISALLFIGYAILNKNSQNQ